MLLPFLAAMLPGCSATNGASRPEPQIVVQTKVVDTACDWTKPIYVDMADVLTDETAKSILAHNRAGAKVCGWKPKAAPAAR
ncbi:conserved exported hypothetical protein [Cupriavidus taiwanensis]|nr:conserved exported hypothetical protein [Cupriavidus taiwanensis]